MSKTHEMALEMKYAIKNNHNILSAWAKRSIDELFNDFVLAWKDQSVENEILNMIPYMDKVMSVSKFQETHISFIFFVTLNTSYAWEFEFFKKSKKLEVTYMETVFQD